MKSLDELLDDLVAYVDTPETSCFSLPPDAYLSPELNALEVRAIFERSWLCVRAGGIRAGSRRLLHHRRHGGAGRHRAGNRRRRARPQHRLPPPRHAGGDGPGQCTPLRLSVSLVGLFDGRSPDSRTPHGRQPGVQQVGLPPSRVPARELEGLPVRQPRRRCGSASGVDGVHGPCDEELPHRGSDGGLPLRDDLERELEALGGELHGVLPPHRPPCANRRRSDAGQGHLLSPIIPRSTTPTPTNAA